MMIGGTGDAMDYIFYSTGSGKDSGEQDGVMMGRQ